MALAQIQARAAVGIDAPRVGVEVHLGGGLPSLSIVGLPNTAVREARDRVRGALTTSGFEFPRRRITVNLAPADLPKDGARFDLAIALGILVASGQIPGQHCGTTVFCAELALSGRLRPVNGTLPVALRCTAASETLVVAADNAAEAALAGGPVHGADLRDVIAQAPARRALEIAAAGGHSLLFCGPPGSGKSLMAARLPGLLPAMTDAEAMESASLHSIAEGCFDPAHWARRPFRSPHHSTSSRALTGGGMRPRPGEISLAHHGVLFLDELPEFPREALEALREPLETGEISVSRVNARLRFPARFQLIAAMNPCPCGYEGDSDHDCRCTPAQIRRYGNRISGPLLDRIDLQVPVPRLTAAQLDTCTEGESSDAVARRIQITRERQLDRDGIPASHLPVSAMRRVGRLDAAGRQILRQATQRFGLSARGWHRCWRIARSIADLDGAADIREHHIAEALSYRERVQR
ncbi:YifB family Mg chelatase-like AAA ATPase [Spiribacter roseus]|uniref:YifB family Mg chelatase-like AAA ATPase n=1 Tax=Spiribacter roseus TaxID=1855875 RepID=A0ABV3RXT1_9GAMM